MHSNKTHILPGHSVRGGYSNWILSGFLALFWASTLSTVIITLSYRWVNPTPTWLMVERYFFTKSTRKMPPKTIWMPLESISPHVIQAVVASEDNLFLTHRGFDLNAIKQAQEEIRKGKRFRGASTITMQTAKNVFLWNNRNWARKAMEAGFTWLIELLWGKYRIMEVYLNVIEMGAATYGVEAASQAYLKRPASEVTRNQAALMATVLPNPLKRNLAKPSPFMLRDRQRILRNMQNIGEVTLTR